MTKTLASLKAYKINKLNCSMIVSLKFAFIMKPTYYQSSFLPLISLKKKPMKSNSHRAINLQ